MMGEVRKGRKKKLCINEGMAMQKNIYHDALKKRKSRRKKKGTLTDRSIDYPKTICRGVERVKKE